MKNKISHSNLLNSSNLHDQRTKSLKSFDPVYRVLTDLEKSEINTNMIYRDINSLSKSTLYPD